MPLAAHSTELNAYFGTYSSVAPLRLARVSDFCRTPFRANSDTIPMVPKNCPTSARNTVRYESERCPAKIGTLSDRNWNHCPTDPGIRTLRLAPRADTLCTHCTHLCTHPCTHPKNAESPCKQALVTLVHTCCTQNHPSGGRNIWPRAISAFQHFSLSAFGPDKSRQVRSAFKTQSG